MMMQDSDRYSNASQAHRCQLEQENEIEWNLILALTPPLFAGNIGIFWGSFEFPFLVGK